MKLLLNVVGTPLIYHILYHVLLCVQDYISEFAEIFADNLGIIVLIEEDLLG